MKIRDELNQQYEELLRQSYDEPVVRYKMSKLKIFVFEMEKKFKKNIEKFSLEDWASIMRMRKLEFSYFAAIKIEIEEYWNFLIQHGEIENQALILSRLPYDAIQVGSRYAQLYFRDIDDIHNMMKELDMTSKDTQVIFGIMLLGYYQLSIEESVTLRKKHLEDHQITIQDEKYRKKIIFIDKKTIEFLRYMSAENKKYVFESRKETCYKTQTIINKFFIVNRTCLSLPVTSKYYGKILQFTKAQKSGLFHMVLMDSIEKGLHPTQIRYSGTLAHWTNYSSFVEFCGWLEYYHGHKVPFKHKKS